MNINLISIATYISSKPKTMTTKQYVIITTKPLKYSSGIAMYFAIINSIPGWTHRFDDACRFNSKPNLYEIFTKYSRLNDHQINNLIVRDRISIIRSDMIPFL